MVPNVYVLILEYLSRVLISNINFQKAPLGLFLYRAYISHKNDSPNLSKKSSGLLMDSFSICLSFFFSCLNEMFENVRSS